MKKLSAADNGFLQVERAETPMHVGGLVIFKIPKGANEKELIQLVIEGMGSALAPISPFNAKLSMSTKPGDTPSLVPVKVELDHHIRHIALPQPKSIEQLTDLVAQFHSQLLDRSRPLWELYVVEGISQRRFALYLKVHHAVMDGMGAIGLMDEIFSSSPDQKTISISSKKKKNRSQPTLTMREKIDRFFSSASKQLKVLPELTNTFAGIAGQLLNKETTISPLWYTAPKFALNVPITSTRGLALSQFSVSEFKKVGKANDATINDLILTVISGALRRFFKENQQLPQDSLVCCVPISIRSDQDGAAAGNAFSSILCSLGTQIEDPLKRLKHVQTSTMKGKEQLLQMSKKAIEMYTIMMATPNILSHLLKISEKVPQPFNILVSNVPASKQTMYLYGAELEAFHAINLIFDMQALNITVTSYKDMLDFSFLSCKTILPEMDKLVKYVEEEFMNLKKISES